MFHKIRSRVRSLLGFSSDHRPVLAHVRVGRVLRLIGTYNAGNRSDARVHADLIRLLSYEPWMLGLQEVTDRARVLRAVAKATGYDLFQVHDHPASAHTAILMHPKAHAKFHSAKLISPRTRVGHLVAGSRRTGWCQPKYLLVVASLGDLYAVIHTIPSAANPINRAARRVFRQQVFAAIGFFKNGGDVLVGDMNGNPFKFKLLRPLLHHARAFTARSHGLRSIDVIYVRKRHH